MTIKPLLYENVEPVDKKRHSNLYVKTGVNYAFAKNVNAVPLMIKEFSQAFTEYPIVFAGNNSKVTPIVVMGFNEKQNLFIANDASWNASYVPAFIRRYPFLLAKNNDGKTLTLCIDENFDGCNEEGRGERLYDSEGKRTQYLEKTLQFLEACQIHHLQTQKFCEHLIELELLEPMQVQFNGKTEEETRILSRFMGVNLKKLIGITEKNILKLFRNDGLELIYQHIFSIRNFDSMTNAMRQY